MFGKMIAVAGIAAVGLTGISADDSLTVTTDQGFKATVPAHSMAPCEFDDGTGAPCVWTADESGDRTGTSFVVLGGYDGPLAYLTNDEARTLVK